MPEQIHAFDELSTRDGFNRSLRHFKFISRIIGEFEGRRNLADSLSDCLADKTIEPRQVLPTLNAILVDKYHYACRSYNLTENFEDFDSLTDTVATWRAIDMVVVYFHPELGVVAVNPKNREHWETIRSLKRNELLTVFAGAFGEANGDKKYDDGIALLISLVEGAKVKTPPSLTKGKFVFRKQAPVAAPAPVVARGRKKAAKGRPSRAEASVVAAPAARHFRHILPPRPLPLLPPLHQRLPPRRPGPRKR